MSSKDMVDIAESLRPCAGMALGVVSFTSVTLDKVVDVDDLRCAITAVSSASCSTMLFLRPRVLTSTGSSSLRSPVATADFCFHGPRRESHDVGGCLYTRNDSEAINTPTPK